MPDDGSAKKPVRRTKPLAPWQRLSFVAVGIVGAGGGAAATFMTKNTVGAGVMLAIGGLFLLIGITGDRPTRAQIGGNQFEFDNEETVEEVLESGPSEARTVVAEKVIQEELPASPPVRRLAEGALYENRAIEALQRVVGGPNVRLMLRARDERFDLTVNYRDKRIGVVIKLARSKVALNQAINQAYVVITNPNWSRDVDAMLIIIQRTEAPELAEGALLSQDKLRVVQWEDERDDQNLKSALDVLIAALETN